MKRVKKVFLKVRNTIIIKILRISFHICLILPIKNKLIMFESFHGKQYSDNPRALFEYMKENHPDYKLIWSADRRKIEKFKEYDILFVKRLSFKWVYLMARSKYWIVNTRLPLWIPKKEKHNIYIQTWHGTPLKKLGVDIENVQMPLTSTVSYRENFKRDSKKWDYLISANRYSTEIFKKAFVYDGPVIETGYPRNDHLIKNDNTEYISNLKEKLSFPKDKKIILYAPTWRDDQFFSKGRYKFDIQLNLKKMKQELGNDFIVLLRMHYLVAENIDISNFKDFVYDLSEYEDIRDLYLLSDILITDYSSVFFDYKILRRPVIFFAYDIDDYRDNLRGFYFDFEKEAPGPIVKSTDEVIRYIRESEWERVNQKDYEDFHAKFCVLENGNASKRVIDQVIEK